MVHLHYFVTLYYSTYKCINVKVLPTHEQLPFYIACRRNSVPWKIPTNIDAL